MKCDNCGKEGGELRTSPSFFCNGYSSRNRRWITYLYGQYLTSFLILFQLNSSFMFGTFFQKQLNLSLLRTALFAIRFFRSSKNLRFHFNLRKRLNSFPLTHCHSPLWLHCFLSSPLLFISLIFMHFLLADYSTIIIFIYQKWVMNKDEISSGVNESSSISPSLPILTLGWVNEDFPVIFKVS